MKIVVSGNVGPRGDGYNPKEFMTAPEARDYHKVQVRIEHFSVECFTLNGDSPRFPL